MFPFIFPMFWLQKLDILRPKTTKKAPPPPPPRASWRSQWGHGPTASRRRRRGVGETPGDVFSMFCWGKSPEESLFSPCFAGEKPIKKPWKIPIQSPKPWENPGKNAGKTRTLPPGWRSPVPGRRQSAAARCGSAGPPRLGPGMVNPPEPSKNRDFTGFNHWRWRFNPWKWRCHGIFWGYI